MGLSCFKLTPSVEATISSLKNDYPQYTDNDIIAIMRATADKYNIPEPSLQDVKRYQASKPKDSTDNIKEDVDTETYVFTFEDGTEVTTPFIPNDQQAYALNQIDKFIKSDETTMTLSGYAGTGKTSLMEIIAAKLQHGFHNIVFTATTNKAAAVLKDRVKKLGYNAVTLNKAFGIGVEVNANSQTYNAKDLETIRNEVKIPSFSVVVIDEASMINEENYKILNDIAKDNELKIIYLGDEAQLSPVNETDISKVFRNSEGKIIRLTKVERTGDNAILKEATALRSGQPLSGESSFNAKGQGVAYIKPNNWSKVKDIIHRFVPQLRTDPNYFRVLAYTNDTVAKYNDAIRRELGYTDYIPRVGEPIVGYNNWGYLGGKGRGANYRFINSESYIVKDVGASINKSYTLSNGQVITVSAVPITIEDPMGKVDRIEAIDIKGNKANYESVKMLAKEKARLWSLYRSGSVDKRQVIADINKIEQFLFVNDDVVDDSNGTRPTLQLKTYDFGYAMTVHKSQGSTFTHVLLDDADITSGTAHSTTKNIKQQLEYVGVSRATDTVTVISNDVKVEGSPLSVTSITTRPAEVQSPAELTKEQISDIAPETSSPTQDNVQTAQQPSTQPQEPQVPTVVKREAPEEVPIDGFNMPNVNRAQFDEEVLRKLGSVTKKKARVELIATSFSQVVDMLIEEDEEANNRKVTNRKQFIIDNLAKILGTQNSKGVLPEMFELAGDDELQAEFDKFNYAKSPGVWMALLEEASPIIQAVEDIVIELRNQNDKEDGRNEEDWEATGENILSLRDGWMMRARELDLYENLSVKTRKLLARIKLAMKYDADGEPIIERDDLGFFRYLNPDYAHLRLLTELHKATDAKNFFELLDKMQEKDPWVKEVIDALNNDEILKSAFYSDLRKEFISYWVHTSNRRGDVQTVEVNKEPTVQYLFNDWMHNYDSHIVLSKISVYNNDGGAIRENGKKVSDACQDIENKLNNADFTLSNPKDIVDDLQEAFAAVGIKLSTEEIERSINQRGIGENIEERSEAKKEFIRKLTGQIAIIGNKIFENGLNKSPFTEFKTAYTAIAELLDLIPEGVTMSSFREGGKSYQSFSNPSWLGRLVTGINGENGEAFIENQYGGFRQYKIGNKWRSPWLAMMMDSKNGAKYRKLFARKVVLHSDHTEYDKWSSADYLGIMLNQFLATNDKNSANYFLPILADAPSAEFIRFVRFSDKNYKDTIVNHLYQVFEQEVERMWLISEREKNNAEKLQNFDSDDSKKFLFFPRLNDADENGTLKGQPGYIDGTNFYKAFLKAREDDRKSRESASPTVKARSLAERAIRNEMEAGLAEFLEEAERYGYNVRNNDILENFYYNSALAYTQLVTLTTSDLAYYKGVTDFQKRFKEVYAMTQRINTEATWENKPVFTKRDEKGRAYESVITLKDIVLVSKVMPEITVVLDKQVESGKMTKLEKDYIISQFKKVNATDAQAWRSLDSYREIMIGTGKWDENMQRAYEHLNSPNQESWTVEDFNIMWLTLKPFLFSLSSVDSEVTLPDGTEYGKIPCPKQFKNSEMLLLSLYGRIAMKESESPFLKAIGRVFNGEATLGTTVDLVQFESTEKVGGQAAINLNGYIKDGFIHIIDTKTKEEIEKIKFDGKYTDGEDIIENEDAILTVFKSKCIKDDAVYERAVKKVPIDDYGIQVTSPEHLLDHEGIIQSQFKKHIAANLPSDFMCKIHGKDFNGDAVYTAIQQILTENIIEGFEECTKLFGSKEAVEKELQRQMAGNQRYTAEDKKACTLVQKSDGTKDWALPLFDPIQSQRIQSLLLSVVKKKVVNPEMKRSYLVQATGVGFSKNLHIRYYDTNGDFIFNEAEFTGEEACRPKFRKLLKEKQNKYETYEAYKKATIKDSNAIAYHEIAMPLYSKELMEYCRKDDNTFDINLLDDSLREAIGLRSPNEAKYSTQPVYIKYLLPVTNGSIVMYPNEITTIVGADFDYDKIMMYFRDFYTSAVGSYNKLSEKEKTVWENQDASYEKLINDVFGVMSTSKENGKNVFKPEDITEQSGYKKWLGYMRENYPEEYRKMMRPSVVKYDPEESIAKLNRKQRNTMFIDLAYAVLTNPSVAGQMHSPGNFDILKQQVKVKRVLKNVTFDQLASALNLTKEANEKREDFKRRVYETLDRTDDDKLKEILQQFSKVLDPKSVATQLYFHRQNSNASNMIGIYAVAGGSHSLLQHTNTTIPETLIMGRKISKIDPMYDLSGKLLSKNIEQFLAASVDDVKDPVLSDLMQNPDTANITNGLIRMGFPISVATSIVVAKNYGVRTQDLEDNKEQIVDWELMELIQLQSQDNLTATEHSESILNGHKENDRLTQGERLRLNELMIKLENTLNVVEPLCNNLQTLTLALRYDAPNNAAGPTLGHVLARFIKYCLAAKRLAVSPIKSDAFDHTKIIGNAITIETTESGGTKAVIDWNAAVDSAFNSGYEAAQMRENAYSNPIPFIQAATKAGMIGPMTLMAQYFPQMNPAIVKILVNPESGFTKYINFENLSMDKAASTLNKVINEFLLYTLNDTPFFGTTSTITGEAVRNQENAGYFMLTFPDQILKYLTENPELRENNRFLANLEFPIKNGIRMIEFRDAKDLSKDEKMRITDSWSELAMSDNATIRNLASLLFKYGSFMGLTYSGPNSFIHLAPSVLRNAIADYKAGLNTALSIRTSAYVEPFVEQFIRNNYNTAGLRKVSTRSVQNYTEGATEIYITALDSIKSGTDIILNNGSLDEVATYEQAILLSHKTDAGWINELFVLDNLVIDKDNKVTGIKYRKAPTLGINGFKEYYNGLVNPDSVLDVYNRKTYEAIPEEQSPNYNEEAPINNGKDEDMPLNNGSTIIPNQSGAEQQETLQPAEAKDPATDESICNYIPGNGKGFISSGISV